jgi:hypothetical protein
MKKTLQNTFLLLAVFAVSYFGSLMGKMTPVAVASDAKLTSGIQGTIRAEAFVLIGEDGKLRGMFTTYNGDPELVLYDKNEKKRAVFALVNNEPGIAIFGDKQNTRGIFYMKNHEVKLNIYDEKNNITWQAK